MKSLISLLIPAISALIGCSASDAGSPSDDGSGGTMSSSAGGSDLTAGNSGGGGVSTGSGGMSSTGSAGVTGTGTGGSSGSGAGGSTGKAGGAGSNSGGSAGQGPGVMSDGGTPPSTPGEWVDITPPVPKPWADSAKFYYGWGWIDGAKADAPGTLYVALDHNYDQYAGIWKTTDGGDTWKQMSSGPSDALKSAPQPIVVDPTNSSVVYAGSIKSGLGVFKSTNGGTSWSNNIIPNGIEHDVYFMSVDPNNHQHLLMTFHSAGANWNGNAGVLETTDGGATWPNAVPAGGWTGAGQFAFFLGKKNDGTADTAGLFWLVATQYNGIYRTENAGAAWSKVADFDMTHGMEELYRAKNDALYLGSVGKIFRSTDNGKSWTDTGAQSTGDGYGGIVGDGTHIWAMLANTGGSAFGPYKWQMLPEDDTTSTTGSSHWQFLGNTTYSDGPNHMIFDPVNKVVYAANWGAGVWRMKLK